MRSFSNVDQLTQPDNLILTRDWFLCGLGQPISDGESDYVRRMILRKRFSLLPRVFAFPLFYFFSFVPLLRSLFLLCLFWAFFFFSLAVSCYPFSFPSLSFSQNPFFFFFLFSPSLSFLSLFPVTLSAASHIYSRCSLSPLLGLCS